MKTYGTLRFEKATATQRGRWLLRAEPQVMMRAKRVFAGAQLRSGTLTLTASVDTGRDLVWFLERYPLEVAPADLVRLQAAEATHEERQVAIADILERRAPAPATFAELAIQPREYQQTAAQLWLARRSLLLADDVGLGKTCSAITGLTDPRTRPALVVTLTHLPRQWESELARFAPSIRVHIPKTGEGRDLTQPLCTRKHPFDDRGICRRCGITREDAYHGRGIAFPDVVILNYHKLAGWAPYLAGHVRSVVFDEAQELRRMGSARYDAAETVARAADFRLGLTATPIYNYGDEMFSLLNVVDGEALGTEDEFKREWKVADRKVEDPVALGSYLRREGLMLRRTREEVGRELPPITRSIHHVESDPAELEKIKGDAAALCRIILARDAASLEKGAQMRAAGELDMKVRQATGIAKAPYVAEFVKLLLDSGEDRVLLYGWHRAVYELWRHQLSDVGVVFYTGTENEAEKAAAKEAFVSGKARVLAMSLRAGAGLDGLQHVCRTVVFGELDWSPGVHEQAIGRVGRDGQKDPVVAYFLLAESGSDPVVADVLGIKRGQIEGLRNPEGELVEAAGIDPDRIRRLAEAMLGQAAA